MTLRDFEGLDDTNRQKGSNEITEHVDAGVRVPVFVSREAAMSRSRLTYHVSRRGKQCGSLKKFSLAQK